MGFKIFVTVIKGKHKLGKNDFVIGKIAGIMSILMHEEDRRSFRITPCSNGNTIIKSIGTQEEYDEFKRIVNTNYTGLCIFNPYTSR